MLTIEQPGAQFDYFLAARRELEREPPRVGTWHRLQSGILDLPLVGVQLEIRRRFGGTSFQHATREIDHELPVLLVE
jgi:hypothetical protein